MKKSYRDSHKEVYENLAYSQDAISTFLIPHMDWTRIRCSFSIRSKFALCATLNGFRSQCALTWKNRSMSQNLLDNPNRLRALGGASFLLALLQSLCTAVFVVSGVRLAIGLTALAAVSGIYAPARGFHQDAIRIPMLILATVGAVVNLAVIGWIRHLRANPAAQWRQTEASPKQRRSERLQIVLAIVTLVMVGLETWTHPMIHRTGPPPASYSVHH